MTSFRITTVWGFALIAILLLFMLFPVQSAPAPYSQMQHNYSEAFSMKDLGLPSVDAPGYSGNSKSESVSTENFDFSMMRGNANVKASSSSVENFEPIADSSKTLFPGPLRDSEIIDKFSQVTSNGVEGKDGCVSSGLTNSRGYICLTPELIKLMTTRGGNATGGDFQVGAPASK